MKRLFALILAFAMLLPVMTAFAAKEPATEKPKAIAQSAYDTVTEDIWNDIKALENKTVTAKRGREVTASDFSSLSDEIVELVLASDTYLEGTLNRNGDFISWQTEQGVACGYSPRLRARIRNAASTGADPETVSGIETVSYAQKGGAPTSTTVSVIEPYYGLDDSFTKQYQTEGTNLAKATGGTYTLYKTDAATIDAIADALETSAVVIFDSHGDTDYFNPKDENDYTSKANTSYLCLTNEDGLTTQDMKAVSGTYGTYYHAFYSDGNCYVDGTAIANHMEKNAPNSLLWSAICLGMATDGIQAPLRAKGVEVAYGYSQSVTFDYDYQWEAAFFKELRNGATVAASVTVMKNAVGNWDCCKESDCNTIAKARNNYCAFPIVVSSEDTYPGHGNVDNLQTVNSSWTIKPVVASEHTPTPVAAKKATCTAPGNIAYWYCTHCQKYFADAACTKEITLESTVLPVQPHSYAYTVTTAPNFVAEGVLTGTCGSCGGTVAIALPLLNDTNYTTEVVTSAACTHTGLMRYTWRNTAYGSFAFDAVLPVLAHSWDGGKVTTEPTQTANGEKTFTCSSCGTTKTETLQKLEKWENSFTDVSEGKWYYDAVKFAVTKELFKGTSATTFSPDGNMTRGMLVTVLWRLDGQSAPAGSNPFNDVPDEKWYTDAVVWAAENSIVGGVGGGRFDPDGNVTREQMAAILFRYAGKKGYDTDKRADLSAYPDAKQISVFAKDAISWANAEGLINGSDGKLQPDGNATRAQVAAILMRYVSNIVNE